MSFYQFLVFVHIFSAILGMGPGFVLTLIFKHAKNMTELRHAFLLRTRLHIYVMIGGTLLLITGLAMGAINNQLFRQLWFITSLAIFLVALSFGPLILKPITTKIRQILKTHPDENIPNEYYVLEKKLLFWEHVENILFLLVIALMILKPYNLDALLRMVYLQ